MQLYIFLITILIDGERERESIKDRRRTKICFLYKGIYSYLLTEIEMVEMNNTQNILNNLENQNQGEKINIFTKNII